MNRRWWRFGAAALALVLVGTAAIYATSTSKRVTHNTVLATKAEGGMPAKLGSHLAQLGESIPGNGGEPSQSESQGPGVAAGIQDFAALAYPKKDVPLTSILAARRAFNPSTATWPW